MGNDKIDFTDIVKKINFNKILLPDFQRGFVWTEEERQKKIIASVLSRIPIGSILLLKSKKDEFLSKVIGCKSKIENSNIKDEIEYLLDGQQRITVLTNVFSNVIHEKCKNINDLISPALKRRFFLKIPKWSKCDEDNDLFGIQTLTFPLSKPDTDEPLFLTNQIMELIEVKSFRKDDNEPYNPSKGYAVELDNYCIGNEDFYLIPLFLLIATGDNEIKANLRLNNIIRSISNNVFEEILAEFLEINDKDRIAFIKRFFRDEEVIKEIIDSNYDINVIKNCLYSLRDNWKDNMTLYLKSCINNMNLNQIVVEESKRSKAIDIYENINLGGIRLSVFDLVMAKVAKVSNQNYYERIIINVHDERDYPIDVIPESMEGIFEDYIKKIKYNASLNAGCYNETNNELSNAYSNAFLNLLSLYCNNKNMSSDNIKIDYIKRNEILALNPEDIDKFCEKICEALDRAIFFLQVRCGIRKINEINYALMLVLIGFVFLNDDWFQDKKVHDLLEAWYWSAIFSGEYDKDQNVRVISNMQKMIKTINNRWDTSWITEMKNNILDAKNFSDKDFLLLENAAELERYPKVVLRHFICQYFLSQTYTDMFNEALLLSVFAKEVNNLQMHHIIPLGSATNVGESTKKLRKNNSNILNSPLNFVYITADANNEISSKSIRDYQKKITDQAYSKLHFSEFSEKSAEVDIKKILGTRYTAIKGNIKGRVDALIKVV